MKIAALQLSAIDNQSELESYLVMATKQRVKIMLLGEYLLNHFFKNLEVMQKKLLIEEVQEQNEMLLRLSCHYPLILVIPTIEIIGQRLYKSIAIINKGKAVFYKAQRLMPYEHWNEAKFFANTIPKLIKLPNTFSVRGLKFGVLFGYELHFDEFWLKLKQSQIDCVLLPSASTFDSSLRWRSIIKMRAFLNSCYILRANRIGQYDDKITNCSWNFYGDSLLMGPNGEVLDCLGDRQELLIVELDKKYLHEIKNCWKFR